MNHRSPRPGAVRVGAIGLGLALLTGGCTVTDTDDGAGAETDAPVGDDLYRQASRMVRDVDAAVDAAGVSDLRRRRIAGPVPCEDPELFRSRASAAGYVTDGSSPEDILARVREVWQREGAEVRDLDTGDDVPTIASRGEDGIRHEAAVFSNRSQPLLTVDIDLPCAPVPAGYEDPDEQLYDRLYDDFDPEVDPDGEQIDEALDPAPGD